METVNISQLSRVYYLRPSERDREHLLDAGIEEALSLHLDAALADLGIGADEEVCVRLVEVMLEFSLGKSHSYTSCHWSRIIADQIRRELMSGGANVVRYRSRRHALIAMADSISKGDLRDSWAWDQLGISRLRGESDLEKAQQQLVDALLRQPELLLTVFVRLAGGRRLVRLLAAMPQTTTNRLLEALMQQAGVCGHWRRSDATGRAERDDANNRLSPGITLQTSEIFKDAVATAARREASRRILDHRCLSILILLELEPIAFQRSDETARASLAFIDAGLRSVTPDSESAARSSSGKESDPRAESRLPAVEDRRDAARSGPDCVGDRSAVVETVSDPGVEGPKAKPEWRFSTAEDHRSARRIDRDATGDVSAAVDSVPDRFTHQPPNRDRRHCDTSHTASADTDMPPRATEAATVDHHESEQTLLCSDYAGLFLLLAVLCERGGESAETPIGRMATAQEFDARPLSWVLHHLTLCWLEIPSDDPALRVFCGVDVDAQWPDPLCRECSAAEQAALAALADDVEQAVLRRFDGRDYAEEEILTVLCRRRARMLIDSGWLELVFDLDQVDTEIRRAGLDLDPGFVPWLGKVVKIRYE